MKTQGNQIKIGSVVRFYSVADKSCYGIVKSIQVEPGNPAEWYDIAWTGRESIDRAVPSHMICLV